MDRYSTLDSFYDYVVGSYISNDAELGEEVVVGPFNIIMDNVKIGSRTVIESHCQIKPRTEIGEDCIVETGCKFSGDCSLGRGVRLKQNVVVGRKVVIADDVFISPNVVFLFADHNLESGYQATLVHDNVFIGSGCQIMPGVIIATGAVIGAGSVVTKDCLQVDGIYIGSPAKFVRMK